MVAAYTLGRRARMYYNSAATYATPTWVPVKRIKDMTLASALETVDASDRDTDYNMDAPVALTKTITAQINRDNAEASYLALEEAHDSLAILDMLVITGDVTDTASRGLRASMSVSKFDEGHPYKGIQMIDLEFKIAPSDNPPVRWPVTP